MTKNFGLSSWDEKVFTGQKNENEKLFPFIKLEDGSNLLRIITMPYKYYAVRVQGTNTGKYGKRIKTAYPAHDDCPAVSNGLKAQERYRVGVISFGTDNKPLDKPVIGILDMSKFGLYTQLQGIKEDKFYGPDLSKLNLVIRVNPKAGAQGYYSVLPRQPEPLSEELVALVQGEMESLEAQLARLTTPSDPEYVAKQLADAGWKKEEPTETSSSNGAAEGVAGEVTDEFYTGEVTDESYTFEAPAAN